MTKTQIELFKEKAIMNLGIGQAIRATGEPKSYWLYNLSGEYFIGFFIDNSDHPKDLPFNDRPTHTFGPKTRQFICQHF